MGTKEIARTITLLTQASLLAACVGAENIETERGKTYLYGRDSISGEAAKTEGGKAVLKELDRIAGLCREKVPGYVEGSERTLMAGNGINNEDSFTYSLCKGKDSEGKVVYFVADYIDNQGVVKIFKQLEKRDFTDIDYGDGVELGYEDNGNLCVIAQYFGDKRQLAVFVNADGKVQKTQNPSINAQLEDLAVNILMPKPVKAAPLETSTSTATQEPTLTATKESSPTPAATSTGTPTSEPTGTATTEATQVPTATQSNTEIPVATVEATQVPTVTQPGAETPAATVEATEPASETGEYLQGKNLIIKDWEKATNKDTVEFPLDDLFSGKLAENIWKQMEEQDYDPVKNATPCRLMVGEQLTTTGTIVELFQNYDFGKTYKDVDSRFQRKVFWGKTVLEDGTETNVMGIVHKNHDDSKVLLFYAFGSTTLEEYQAILENKGIDMESIFFYPEKSMKSCGPSEFVKVFCSLTTMKENNFDAEVNKLIKTGLFDKTLEGKLLGPAGSRWVKNK